MGRFERMEEAPPTPSSMLRPAEVETPLLGRGLAAQEPPLLSPRHKRLGGIVLATAAALVIAGFVLGRSTNDASAPTGGASAPSAAGGALPSADVDAAETSPSAATTTATTTTTAASAAGASSCAAEWTRTATGYYEACTGNVDAFEGLSVAEAKAACCSSLVCAGFSYENATGSGFFKRDARCGVVASDAYAGFTKAHRIPELVEDFEAQAN